MNKLLATSVLAAAVTLTGCASIVSESEYPVRFQSTPSAQFTVTDSSGMVVHSGNTPEVVQLPASRGFFSGETYVIKYNADGYEQTEVAMKSTVDGWIIGNLIFGGVIGLVVDGATGAMFALPDSRNTTLPASDVSTLQLFNINELTDEERTQLVGIN